MFTLNCNIWAICTEISSRVITKTLRGCLAFTSSCAGVKLISVNIRCTICRHQYVLLSICRACRHHKTCIAACCDRRFAVGIFAGSIMYVPSSAIADFHRRFSRLCAGGVVVIRTSAGIAKTESGLHAWARAKIGSSPHLSSSWLIMPRIKDQLIFGLPDRSDLIFVGANRTQIFDGHFWLLGSSYQN